MLRSLLLASVALVPFAMPAQAACTIALPSNGDTVTCTGIDTTGIVNNQARNVTVTIEDGAAVNNAATPGTHVIHLRDGASVTVHGALASAPGSNRDAMNLRHDASVTINGPVSAPNPDSDGVQAEDRLSLTVEAGGSITAGKKGVNGGDGDESQVVNHGTIIAGTEGVELGDESSVVNHGTIEGDDDAINIGERATIENHGMIRSKRDSKGADFVQDGIDLDSGIITNFGTILSEDDAAIDFDATDYADEASVIVNTGLIEGKYGIIVETGTDADGNANGETANIARQEVYNGGTIQGIGGLALNLGAGDDLYVGFAGSRILGDLDLGLGDDLVQTATGAAIYGDVRLGAGNDIFVLSDRYDPDTTFTFGLIDGGAGTDVVSFADYSFADLATVDWLDDIVSLGFLDGFALRFTNFDTFSFSDVTVAVADLSLPAVPVPAPALMLLSALGGFAALRRRHAR